MDVGVLVGAGASFDIDAYDETDSILIRNDKETRWLYKNETSELVILEKTESISSVFPAGTLLKISEVNGFAQPVAEVNITAAVCGRLCIEVDFSNTSAFNTRSVQHEGVTRTAVLVPVRLY